MQPYIRLSSKLLYFTFAFIALCVSQQIVIPLSLEDDKPPLIPILMISHHLSDLPISQKTHQNTFIEKQFEISTQQTFTYSSTVLSPIFVLEKNSCHAHQGTVEISKLEDIYYHDSFATTSAQEPSNPLGDPSQSVSLDDDPLSLSQEHTWIYNKKYNVLYKISSSLKIDAYKLKNESISKKIQSLKDDKQITMTLESQQSAVQKSISQIATLQLLATTQERSQFFTQCSEEADVLPILSKNLEKMYVFVCNAIFMIECQAVLAKRQTLMVFGSKNERKEMERPFMGIEVKTVNEYIFWLSETSGIRIYGITMEGRLEYVETLKVPQEPLVSNKQQNKLKSPAKETPKLSSLEYINGMLYVLTLSQGVFIYERLSAYHFELVSYLEYLPELTSKVNKELIIEEDRMVIWTESKKWQFVSEINIKSKPSQNEEIPKKQAGLSSGSMSYSLNRYFKGYRSISQVKILSQNNKNSQTSAQKLLLLVSQKGIELYPLNKDPREISMMMNGVINSHIGKDIRDVYQVGNGLFVFQSFKQTYVEDDDSNSQEDQGENENSDPNQTQQNQESSQTEEQVLDSSVVETYLVLMNPKYPSIQCKFQSQGVYTLFVQQEINPHPIPKPLAQNLSTKKHNSTSHIQAPPQNPILHFQPHFYHKLHIKVNQEISIEYITFLVSILSISFLIAIISLLIYWRQNKLTLIDKLVLQIRKLHQSRLRSIEFQERSPPKAIERRWDELREEIQGEISYKIDNTEDNPDFDNNLMSERNFFKENTSESQEARHKIEPFTDPIKSEVSPLSQKSQENSKSVQIQQQNRNLSNDLKTLKKDMQMSHQEIVIQSPSYQKHKQEGEGELSGEQNEFEDLNFGVPLSEELEKQVNLSILDEDLSEKDKVQLLERGREQNENNGNEQE